MHKHVTATRNTPKWFKARKNKQNQHKQATKTRKRDKTSKTGKHKQKQRN